MKIVLIREVSLSEKRKGLLIPKINGLLIRKWKRFVIPKIRFSESEKKDSLMNIKKGSFFCKVLTLR